MNNCQNNNQEAVANVLTAAIEKDIFQDDSEREKLKGDIDQFMNACQGNYQEAVAKVLTVAIESDKFDKDWLHVRILELMKACQGNNQEAVANVLTAAIESDKFDEDWLHDRISELMNTCQNKDDQEAVVCVLKAVADVLEATIESDKFDDKALLKEHISNFLNACSVYNDDYIQIYKTVYNAAKDIFTEEERAVYENEIKFYEEKNKACPFGIVPSSNDPVPLDPEKLGIIDGNEELREENEKRQQRIKKLFESGEPFGEKKVSEIKTADDFIKYFAEDKKDEFIAMLNVMNIGDKISFTRLKTSKKNVLHSRKKFTISKVNSDTFDIEIKIGIIGENTLSFKIYTQMDDTQVLQLASEEPQYDDETDDETDDEYHADFELFKMQHASTNLSDGDMSSSSEVFQDYDFAADDALFEESLKAATQIYNIPLPPEVFQDYDFADDALFEEGRKAATQIYNLPSYSETFKEDDFDEDADESRVTFWPPNMPPEDSQEDDSSDEEDPFSWARDINIG